MAEIWTNFSGGSYPEKEMKMARSHFTEAFLFHHEVSFDLESILKGVEREVDHGTPGDVR